LHSLVAEDDAVNQKLILHILRKLGHQADVAGTGLEAMAALERQPYDVVVLDVRMPEMDGLAVARYICQKWPQDQRPYMIAVTGNAMQGDREQCLSAGMDDYVTKPVREEELVSAIARRRSLSGQTQPPAAPALATTTALPPPHTSATPSARTATYAEALAKVRETLGENGEQLLAELIDCYLVDTPELLATMHTAIAQHDARVLQSTAHKLKSSSAFLGATALVTLCRELEHIDRVDATDNCRQRVLQIEAEYARIRATLENERLRTYAATSRQSRTD
jgi:CheY-like chemotaxis protein